MEEFFKYVPEWLLFLTSFICVTAGALSSFVAFKTSVNDKFLFTHAKIKSTRNELLAKIDNQRADIDCLRDNMLKMSDDITLIKVMVAKLVAISDNNLE